MIRGKSANLGLPKTENMQEEFSRYVASLLYQHQQLSIPGLGSFELAHEPALVDQVQGQVGPPSKKVSFNANLVMDDGLLVAKVQEMEALDAVAADAWIREAVDAIKKKLERREIVELPGVGRFYRNFEQQLQFVADQQNFNPDAYGLQPVQAYPVSRRPQEGLTAKTTAGTPITSPSPPPASAASVSSSISSLFQRYLPYIGAIAFILVAVALYFLFIRPDPPAAPDPTVGLPEERLNTSPSRTIPDEETAELSPDQPGDDPEAMETIPAEEDMDTEAPTLAPTEHTAVIAVGLFGSESNVQRLVSKLFDAGFNAYTGKEGSLTRVGVQLRYEEEEDLQRTLRDVQEQFEESAFILYQDGERLERE